MSSPRITQLFDILYDILISTFSIIDIIMDICVTYDFYQREKYVFFYISLAIFILAQISYASIMTISLERTTPHQSFRSNFISHALVFMLALPFGQLVPLFLMIQNTFSSQFIQFYERYQYRSVFLKKKESTMEFSSLTLSDYIKRKAVAHIGFIAESVIEAIPQSILQMVSIILYREYNAIHIFSIFMSMTVVVTKGSLLTYSVYKPASVFNFLCFAVDIFGIFACVSWLFCVNNDTLNDASYVIMGYGVWRIAYYYFIVLYVIGHLLVILAVLGLCIACLYIYKNSDEYPWKEMLPSMILYAGTVLLTLPISLILFTTRFTLIPIFILRGLDHSRQKSLPFYRQLFNFLLNTHSISDIHHRLMITNWRLAVLTHKHGKRLHLTSHKTTFAKCKAIVALQQDELNLFELYQCLRWDQMANYHWVLQQIDLKRFYKDFKTLFNDLVHQCYQFLMKHKWNMLYCVMLDMHAYVVQQMNKLQIKSYVTSIWNMIKEFIQSNGHGDYSIYGFYLMLLDIKDHVHYFGIWCMNHAFNITFWKYYMRLVKHVCFQYMLTPLVLIIKNLLLAIAQDIINIFLICACTRRQPFVMILCTWSIPPSWRWRSANIGNVSYYTYFPPTKIDPIPQYRYTDGSRSVRQLRGLFGYFGYGIYTFVVCFVYYLIHAPIRDFWRLELVRVVVECGMFFTVVVGLVPCILFLAVYSLFLPLIFAITSLIYWEWYDLQIILTVAQCVLFTVMILLIPWVWRFVYCDFHLFPYFNDQVEIPARFSKHVINVYYGTTARNDAIFNTFPNDIARVIIAHLPLFHIWDDKGKSIRTKRKRKHS